jgi:hypothetical protein
MRPVYQSVLPVLCDLYISLCCQSYATCISVYATSYMRPTKHRIPDIVAYFPYILKDSFSNGCHPVLHSKQVLRFKLVFDFNTSWCTDIIASGHHQQHRGERLALSIGLNSVESRTQYPKRRVLSKRQDDG